MYGRVKWKTHASNGYEILTENMEVLNYYQHILNMRLTHWCRLVHTCACKLRLIAIGSENGLSPGSRQAIIWTNAGILLIGPLRTNFSEILIKFPAFSFKKMHLKISFGKWPFCLGLNVFFTSSIPGDVYSSRYYENCVHMFHVNPRGIPMSSNNVDSFLRKVFEKLNDRL